MGSSSQVTRQSCPHFSAASSRPASRSHQHSQTSDVLRGMATSPTQFSATNTTTASTTSQRTGCAQMVLSSTPSAERGSLAIITSTLTEVTDRKDCKADAYETNNGFTCPEKAPTDEFGQFDPHPKYSDSDDCAKFYICLNGISPREQGCELGLVYNEVSKQCDAPENVPECKDYYAFLEDGEQSKKRRK